MPQRGLDEADSSRVCPANPKGIVASSPRLAQRLPWVIAGNRIINRNAVVADDARAGAMGTAATALRLVMICEL